MQTPKKVSLREEPEGPVFVYHWRDLGFIFPLLLSPVFVLLPIWAMVNNLEYWFVVLLLLLVASFGLGLTYYSLGRVINRTEIGLQHGMLSVHHKPLPWGYRTDLPVGEINALNQETYYNQSQKNEFDLDHDFQIDVKIRNERLTAYTQDGKAHILIPKIELAAAQFLEGEIEARLGLRQVQSAVEREMGLQLAQQEQRRVESSQGMMMIPYLILTTPLVLVVSIGMLIGTINDQREGKASLTWPSTEARVVEHRIEISTQTNYDNSNTTYFVPVIVYEYAVEGNSYKIEDYLIFQSEFKDEVARQFENYPLGTPLTIFYNPEKPDRSRFERGPNDPTIPYIIAGVCLALVPLVTISMLFMARENCRANGCPDDWKHWPFWRNQIPLLNRLAKTNPH